MLAILEKLPCEHVCCVCVCMCRGCVTARMRLTTTGVVKCSVELATEQGSVLNCVVNTFEPFAQVSQAIFPVLTPPEVGNSASALPNRAPLPSRRATALRHLLHNGKSPIQLGLKLDQDSEIIYLPQLSFMGGQAERHISDANMRCMCRHLWVVLWALGEYRVL